MFKPCPNLSLDRSRHNMSSSPYQEEDLKFKPLLYSPLDRGENGTGMKTGIIFEAKTKKYHLKYRDSLTWAAKNNRKNETESEKLLWNKLLRKKNLGYKFTRQKPINRFIVDFYCSELSLAIEIDGDSHNLRKDRDSLRDKYLYTCGIKTLRISDKDVINDIGKVEKEINEFIRCSPVKGSCP
ncbi:MAG: endonuclease domain-containing protein [Candidatus Shapirobacteria bacterium]